MQLVSRSWSCFGNYERQALTPVHAGAMTAEETERVGLTLMLEKRMGELRDHFGLIPEEAISIWVHSADR